jgi:type VI protein secretion system component Hcp
MAVTHLLQIDGIEGEADIGGHPKTILCDTWSAGIVNEGSSRSATTGGSGGLTGGSGKSQFTAPASKASPKLMENCGTGKHFKKATLFVLKSTGAAPMDHLKITFEDAVITDHALSYTPPPPGAKIEDAVRDVFSLSYTKVTIEHKGQTKEGSAGAGTEGVHDFAKGSK